MTLLMSSLALLLVSARTDRDIIIQTTGGVGAGKGGVRPKTPDGTAYSVRLVAAAALPETGDGTVGREDGLR